MKTFHSGAYPTMVTPYNKDGSVDVGAVRALVDWYWKMGLDGIFASCQSSEIHCLSLSDRVLLARLVKEEADRLAATDRSRPPMTVVASGHISDSFEDQRAELLAVAETGCDALILISNRFDIENTGDAGWISDLERLMKELPSDLPLGIYECPRPYKRLLTPAMLRYLTESGRFAFIKDTCCDADEIKRRLALIAGCQIPGNGYRPLLFNANAQTFYTTLMAGAAGYCGVMCNFHPDLYVYVCKNVRKEPEKAALVSDFLTMAAFIESLTYPCIAKYALNQAGVTMNFTARTNDVTRMKPYDLLCVDSMERLAEHFREVCQS